MKITASSPRFAIAGVPLAEIRIARVLSSRGHQVTMLLGYVEPDFQFPAVSGLSVWILSTPKVSRMLWR